MGGLEEGYSVVPEEMPLDNPLSKVLSDESIQLLSLKEDVTLSRHSMPKVMMFRTILEQDNLVKPKIANGSAPVSKSTLQKAKEEATVTPTWSQFPSSGFGETTAPGYRR